MPLLIDSAYLPIAATFIFVFAIVLGLLTSTKIFEKKPKVEAAIAFVFGLFSITYEPLVAGLMQYIPIASLVLIIVFFMVFLKKAIGDSGDSDMLPRVVSLAFLLLLIGIFWDELSQILPIGIGSGNALWLIGLIIVVLILYGAYRHKP